MREMLAGHRHKWINGPLILTIASITLCEANVLCETLRQRSLAAHQPFQLPLYGQEVPEWVWLLSEEPWSMAIEVHAGWLYVNRHNCSSHVELLKAFGC